MDGQNSISIDPYVQQKLGSLTYETIILRAQLDDALKRNEELVKIAKKYEEVLEEPKKK
jgi:hypothetical protein